MLRAMKAKMWSFQSHNLTVSMWFEAFWIIVILVTQFFVEELTNIAF